MSILDDIISSIIGLMQALAAFFIATGALAILVSVTPGMVVMTFLYSSGLTPEFGLLNLWFCIFNISQLIYIFMVAVFDSEDDVASLYYTTLCILIILVSLVAHIEFDSRFTSKCLSYCFLTHST